MSQIVSASAAETGLIANHTYEAWANDGCGGLGACYDTSNDRFLIGPEPNGGKHSSLYKTIIAHEFGHNIHAKELGADSSGDGHGIPGYTYNASVSQPFAPASDVQDDAWCRCDYINTSNVTHCPPVAVSCMGDGSDPTTKWMETKCPDNDSHLGNEWDWMRALYRINTQTTNKYSLSDLASIYRLACSGSTTGVCTAGSTSTDVGENVYFNATPDDFYYPQVGTIYAGYTSLVDAACSVEGGSCDSFDAKFSHFFNSGQSQGINH